MTERLTDEKFRELQENVDTYTMVYSAEVLPALAELVALRAAWKIAEPHLLYPIRRRCLSVLSDAPQ